MRRLALLVAMSMVLWAGQGQAAICGTAGAAPPPDCIDCSGSGCTVTKYGLGGPNNYKAVTDPLDDLLFTHDDFDGSYAYNKASGGADDPACGGEGEFIAQFGQFLLRERTGCVPTAAGATCAIGGAACRTVEAASPDCGGGACVAPGGCPVEFATDLAPPLDIENPNKSFFSGSRLIYSPIDLGGGFIVTLWLSVASNGVIVGRGTRYNLPGTADPDDSRVHWDKFGADSEGGGSSTLCCNHDAPFNFCAAISGGNWLPYPVINNLQDEAGIYRNWPDWLFEGRAGTRFTTDASYTEPGQQHGVCTLDRDWGCTSTGTHTGPSGNLDCGSCVCGQDRCDDNTNHCRHNTAVACLGDDFCCLATECGPIQGKCALNNALACTADFECRDAPCKATPVAGSTCDLREMGWRLQELSTNADGTPNPTMCGGGVYFFQGIPNQFCGLGKRYAVDGDPGPSCAVQNFTLSVRPDLDCDGDDDVVPDKCPYFSEIDAFGDANNDGRGNECQCGDTARPPGGATTPLGVTVRPDGTLAGYGNGDVAVQDLISTNVLLFSYASDADWDIFNPTCDSNDDGALQSPAVSSICTVSDLVATNQEIFSAGPTATCARVRPPTP